MTLRPLTLGGLLLAVLAAPAQAQMSQMNHGTMTSGMPGTAPAPDLTRLTGRAFDRAFLSMMIGHHQGAIDMSRAVLTRVQDPQVRKWTQATLQVQQQEITRMTTWLQGLGGVDRAAQASMAAEMKGMLAAMNREADRDRALVAGMLPHHASALDMASLALQRGSDARVLQLAREILRTQADEMYAYRQWLLAHPR